MSSKDQDTVLEVKELRTHLFTKMGVIKAVDGVSFDLKRGETLGIVGESGSGKSMTAMSLFRLLPSGGRTVSGSVNLEGEELLTKSESEMRRIRGRRMSMILQDPQSSLDPVFTVGTQLMEALRIQEPAPRKELRKRAVDILRSVNVADPERRVDSYPHQMSGGMKQRVVGGIAISGQPTVLVADEPTTALDVTIQSQYMNLLNEIKEATNLSIIFITHDMGIVASMCDRVMVMYSGRIVESGSVREIFNNPQHPYTKALMASVPTIDRKTERLFSIEGTPPPLWDLPEGCRFAPRCPVAMDRCMEEYPPTVSFVAPDEVSHEAACWLAGDTDHE